MSNCLYCIMFRVWEEEKKKSFKHRGCEKSCLTKNVYHPKEHAENEKNEIMKATENPKPAAPTKPKKATEISGYDAQSSQRHIYCPGCGKIITHSPSQTL